MSVGDEIIDNNRWVSPLQQTGEAIIECPHSFRDHRI
jgi:hypothetical protein